MAEGDFKELEILSQEDIIKGVHLKIDKAFAEFIRRGEISEFLEEFCAPHTENRVWSEMLKGGGAYMVSELPPFVDVSVPNLYKIIGRLYVRGLVKMVGNRYQAVSPEAFIRERRTQKRESKRISQKLIKNSAQRT